MNISFWKMFKIYLAGLLNIHFCDNFTNWEQQVTVEERSLSRQEWLHRAALSRTIKEKTIWQVRKCIVCGYVQTEVISKEEIDSFG